MAPVLTQVPVLDQHRILVVEDDPDFSAWEVRLLTQSGARVTLACDGAEALLALQHGVYDLIVCDLDLPRINGFELMDYARKQAIHDPFLFVTAHRGKANQAYAMAHGAQDFIPKPVKSGVFLERVGRLLASRAPAPARRGPQRVGRVSRRIGDFEVIGLLGYGGMGVVFRARQVSTGREVALKLLHMRCPGDSEEARCFEAECEAVAMLDHPNVVRLFAAGVDTQNGRPYLAMEAIKGVSLRDHLRRNTPTFGAALAITRGLTHAVQAAWHERLVHRDIKPSNVILSAGGMVKLLDFGLVKHLRGSQLQAEAGVLLGSPSYIAPERINGESEDCRTDLYAIGIVLYRMLAGRTPFRAPSDAQILSLHLCGRPRQISKYRHNVPEDFDRLLARLLAKRPEQRLSHPRILLEELDRIEAGLRAAGRLGEKPLGAKVPALHFRELSYQPPESPWNRGWLVAIGVVVLLGCVLAAVF